MNAHDLAALRFVAGSGGALCTLTGIDGSFSRELGAHLAVGWDGSIAGSLADGCLESELASAARSLRGSRAETRRYGRGSPQIDFRLPCGSGLDILIDPAPDRAAIARVLAALDAREEAVLALPDPRLPARICVPPLRLVLFGAGPEVAALAALAGAAGIATRVEVPGESAALSLGAPPALPAPDAWSAAILLFHDHEWEAPILDWALASEAFFIGAIGGAAAREVRRSGLAARGHDAAAIARVRSPVGLVPAARDPMTLALSILAEAVGAYEAARRAR